MPPRTDLVSGAECDRVAWPHHAATEAMGQGEERGTRRPEAHRKAAWTPPKGRLGNSPDHLAPSNLRESNALIRAIVYGDHGTKWQQVALSPQFRRIKTWNGSAVQEEGVLALQLVSEQTRKLAEGNLSF
jgi:hypothetical protein